MAYWKRRFDRRYLLIWLINNKKKEIRFSRAIWNVYDVYKTDFITRVYNIESQSPMRNK